VVEWADRFQVMPRDHLRLELAHAGAARTLEVTGRGPRGQALASALAAELLGSPA
jgi:tRNA A37 threonylcarbamoyladenosine biosynthesis protein TsaE